MESELRELINHKDKIEKEISELTVQIEVIDSTKNFRDGLVDGEGFPRADLNFG